MRTWIMCFVFFAAFKLCAESYVLSGGQKSRIDYTMTQQIGPPPGTAKLTVNFVEPQTFKSPTYNQEIIEYALKFSTPPKTRTEKTDKRGNKVITTTWIRPRQPVEITIVIKANNYTLFNEINPDAPFPVDTLPPDLQQYLQATKQVPADHPGIIKKAKELTSGAENQYEAVQQILSFIIDGMRYVQRPRQYDSWYSLNTGRGNCQNYSHLAATFMRAVGIPVRIVNGVTLPEKFHVKFPTGIMTMGMAEARHSWVEVWFPDLGWVPFDPQQMQLFVSNRFIRVEVGLDNNETIYDGAIRWTQSRGSRGTPKFQETIAAQFVTDDINVLAERQPYGPKKMLFTPAIVTDFTEVVHEAAAVAPMVIPPQKLQTMTYTAWDTVGNLDFPANMDFLSNRDMVKSSTSDEMLLKKNFLAETAEYVTTKGQRYAQIFRVDNPMDLAKIGLALHAFGGSGQLWVELLEDSNGKPGSIKATSNLKTLKSLPKKPGYDWVDFSFVDTKLSPGSYWIALAYTGSPIVNWFFTYGKPVGPPDGTRYNTMFDETWSHSLAYEFNYRIIGKKP